MLRIILVEFFSIFCALLYCVLVTSTKYGMEKVELSGASIVFQQFYSQKTETMYQCMELCSRYSICKSFWFGEGVCELLKNRAGDPDLLLSTKRGGKYVDANRIPESIAGACSNSNCSNKTKCVPHPTLSYVCLPHNFPIFTCPKEWFYSIDKCFKVYLTRSTPLSWQQARDYCAQTETNLTEIRTMEEEQLISNVLGHIANASAKLEDDDGQNVFWISLSYHMDRESWIWNASGRVWDNNSVTLLSPKYQNVELDQNSCMALYVNKTYNFTDTEWRVVKCSSKFFFACERIMLP